jgi:hypothetical protein
MLWGAPGTVKHGPARLPDAEAASAARLSITIAPDAIADRRGMAVFPLADDLRELLIAKEYFDRVIEVTW